MYVLRFSLIVLLFLILIRVLRLSLILGSRLLLGGLVWGVQGRGPAAHDGKICRICVASDRS